MLSMAVLSVVCSFVCLLIVVFYLLRLIGGRRWLHHRDVENDVGHGLMAAGMATMLVVGNRPPPFLLVGMGLLFTFATLWWTVRLFVHHPLLELLLGKSEPHSPVSPDAIHILMQSGMGYMCILMGSMVLSMSLGARCLTDLFGVVFAVLTVWYGREVLADLRSVKKDGLQLGANLAHVLMSAMMCMMFLNMIAMTMTMIPT